MRVSRRSPGSDGAPKIDVDISTVRGAERSGDHFPLLARRAACASVEPLKTMRAVPPAKGVPMASTTVKDAYRRINHDSPHVRGYKEKGNINTPLDLAIDVIDRVPRLRTAGAHAKEKLRNMQIECRHYAYEHGVDKPEIDGWTWPW